MNESDAEIGVAGAGPVGSFLALRLEKLGLRVVLFERRAAPPERSMAIGLMPPSLRRFAKIGMAETLIRGGCRVRRAIIHDARGELGHLDFSGLPPPFDFILSLPQSRLIRHLWERLTAAPGVDFRKGMTLESFEPTGEGVVLRGHSPTDAARFEGRVQYLVLCEGVHGRLRHRIGARAAPRSYGLTFAMGDAPDVTPWAADAHLYFTPDGSVESFPLPEGRRRWVVLRRPGDPASDIETLRARVGRIAGFEIAENAWFHVGRFAPERRLERRWVSGRVMLCGDAAHAMSPIGGQGMNTGVGDADRLADALHRILRHGESATTACWRYEIERGRAFRIAARRAARGMWLGTRTGSAASNARSMFVRALLRSPKRQPRLARYFAMWDIPGNRRSFRETIL